MRCAEESCIRFPYLLISKEFPSIINFANDCCRLHLAISCTIRGDSVPALRRNGGKAGETARQVTLAITKIFFYHYATLIKACHCAGFRADLVIKEFEDDTYVILCWVDLLFCLSVMGIFIYFYYLVKSNFNVSSRERFIDFVLMGR